MGRNERGQFTSDNPRYQEEKKYKEANQFINGIIRTLDARMKALTKPLKGLPPSVQEIEEYMVNNPGAQCTRFVVAIRDMPPVHPAFTQFRGEYVTREDQYCYERETHSNPDSSEKLIRLGVGFRDEEGAEYLDIVLYPNGRREIEYEYKDRLVSIDINPETGTTSVEIIEGLGRVVQDSLGERERSDINTLVRRGRALPPAERRLVPSGKRRLLPQT